MHVLDQAWERLKSDFDQACSQASRAARWELTSDLNQLLRRLRRYQSQDEWASTLVEAAGRFVSQAAVFEIAASLILKLRAQLNLDLPVELEIPLSAAPAFGAAIASRDSMLTLRVASEVSEHLQSSDPEARSHLLPIFNGERAVAILFAAGGEYVDVNGLEVIAGIASLVLERAANRSLHLQVASAPSGPEPEAANHKPLTTPRPLPAWADLPTAEQSRHVQAQRFARVTLAELQLARPDAFRSGREEGNLYLYLKPDIDRARETFRNQFLQTPSMVDYLHLEFVNSAAGGDESKLGAEYPGPLV